MDHVTMSKKKTGIAKLLEYGGSYRTLTIFACVLSGISSVTMLAPFICLWNAVKTALQVAPDFDQLGQTNFNNYAWAAFIFAVIAFILYYIALTASHIAAFHTAKNMKYTLVKHLATLPLGFFSVHSSGKLRKIIDENTNQTENFLAHQLPDMVGAAASPLALIIFLFVFDWRFGLCSMIPLLLGFVTQGKMMNGTAAKHMKQYQDDMEDMNKEAVEYVRGIPVVKIFQQTVYSFKSFYHSILNYKKSISAFALACENPMTLFTTVINAAFVLLIPAIICFSAYTDNYTDLLSDWLFYILITPACGAMINRVMYISTNKMLAEEAVRRTDLLLKEEALSYPATPQVPTAHDIVFKDVVFSYSADGAPAVNHISLNIKQGQTVALVGPSGSGKSTLASLIPRFYDVTNGIIEIGSIDVRNISEQVLMDRIAFVFQNTQLFKESIRDNLKAVRPSATIAEIEAALSAAQCQDIIQKLPDGLDTVIGAKGTYLSGGEQQRIALARAILKDSPIIVLDEATAFADAENEHKIQQAFAHLLKGKTVLMIAHRLTTVKNADLIVVMDHGQIKETGSHDELLHQKGLYALMWENYQTSINWGIRKEKN